MGFDPRAGEGQGPSRGSNHLPLLAAAGVGTNDLDRIDTRGEAIKDVVCPFGPKAS
jgi:hypothetical protein